ncbi:hypothetical protein FACS189415_1490 [Bacteroidia bacterium]|nr:hypothetical protein FACS189415_1490 [Bacteroidia bacterium]
MGYTVYEEETSSYKGVEYEFCHFANPFYVDSNRGDFSPPYENDIIPNEEVAAEVMAIIMGRGDQAAAEYYRTHVWQASLQGPSKWGLLVFERMPGETIEEYGYNDPRGRADPRGKFISFLKPTGEILEIEGMVCTDAIPTKEMAIDVAIAILSRGDQEAADQYIRWLDEVTLNETTKTWTIECKMPDEEAKEIVNAESYVPGSVIFGTYINLRRTTGEVLSIKNFSPLLILEDW